MLCHWDFHTMFKYHGLKKPHSNLVNHHRRHRQHQTSEVEKSQIGFLLKEDLWTYNVVWVD